MSFDRGAQGKTMGITEEDIGRKGAKTMDSAWSLAKDPGEGRGVLVK